MRRTTEKEFSSRDFCKGADVMASCRCSHEVDVRADKIRECILETHLEVKNQLISNLEDIIDEQEARIRNMDDFITGRVSSLSPRHKTILKGISLLSLDFGALSEENLALKQSLLNAQRCIRLLQLQLSPCKPVAISVDVNIQTDEEKGGEEEENNNTARRDRETALALKKHVAALRSAKAELSDIAREAKQWTSSELAAVGEYVSRAVGAYARSLVARYQHEVDARRRLHNKLVEINGNIRVFCRVRPPGEKEDVEKTVISVDPLDNGILTVQTPSCERKFTCDRAFTPSHSQADIFEEVRPIITSCVDGYNVCIFAYGHTGSGKTYTMEGPSNSPGINQRSLDELFRLARERSRDFQHTICMSMLEIYNEKIRDLLSKSKENLCIRIGDAGALEIPGLSSIEVANVEDVRQVLSRGHLSRVVATTEANDRSSRSHAVVRVTIRSVNTTTGSATEGRLNLVDLAGSERVSLSGAAGLQLREAQCINRSLSELGNVVSALRQRQHHIPFRNCQLTRLLEDCLNGDSKTLMIVQLAPGQVNVQESLSSLNFAEKVSKVQTKALQQNGYGFYSLSTSNKISRPKLETNFVRSSSVRGPKKSFAQ